MTARSILVVALTAITLSSTACATAGGSGSSSSNTLTATELASANTRTVYDAVDLLRPRWFRSRGMEPDVYMDGIRAGDLDYLRNINVTEVAELHFYPAGQEGGRFGGNPNGVIEIIRP